MKIFPCQVNDLMHKNGSIVNSFKNAFYGLFSLLKTENNAKIHLIATITVLLISSFLPLSVFEWIFIMLAIFLVWIAELFNTSLEYLFNLVEPNTNPVVKTGKDMSAAAVLLTALFSVIVGVLILLPEIHEKVDLISR